MWAWLSNSFFLSNWHKYCFSFFLIQTKHKIFIEDTREKIMESFIHTYNIEFSSL